MLDNGRMIYNMEMEWKNGQHKLNMKFFFEIILDIQGQYFKGKKHGKGKLTFEDGTKYIGEFVDNQVNGIGEFHWQEGKYYKG